MTTKLSRAEQFGMAFEDFMFKEFVDTGKLHRWALNLSTQNTRKNIHDYTLVLPRTYFAYVLDTQITLADGTKEGPGPIHLPHEMPPIDELIQTIRAHFSQFSYVEDERILSEVRINKEATEDEIGNKHIDIQVVYYKKYQPYPVQLTREQELEVQLMQAERRAQDAENNYQLTQQILENERDEYMDVIQEQQRRMEAQTIKLAKMESVLRKMALEIYAKEEDPTPCPVCFDPITVEKFNITHCGHHVCTDCNSKCTKCPLCREAY
uniref:RING-type domain-containing protein n=1 Tax=viral metagenome TaxID=1070528 RepID=A0A6C0HIV5_9ZZZZ